MGGVQTGREGSGRAVQTGSGERAVTPRVLTSATTAAQLVSLHRRFFVTFPPPPASCAHSPCASPSQARSSKKPKKEPKYPIVNDVEAMIATLKGVDRDTALTAYGMPEGVNLNLNFNPPRAMYTLFHHRHRSLSSWPSTAVFAKLAGCPSTWLFLCSQR